MKAFATLIEKLALTPSRNRKINLLVNYFRTTPDEDRGYALAVLTGNLTFRYIKASQLKEITTQQVDANLFKLSYDYVGDLAETIALIWPHYEPGDSLPSLASVVKEFQEIKKAEVGSVIERYLTRGQPTERWALIKLATGGLRIGVSARLAKTALAKMGDRSLEEIEEIWHGLLPPYNELFSWLDGKAEKPAINHSETFHPLMLSNPVDEEKDFKKLLPADFTAEWKWDGIRVQIAMGPNSKAMYSRTGDNISPAFPDILNEIQGEAVLDGELLVGEGLDPAPFNHLQQRLNRKSANAGLQSKYPAFVRVYDILFDGSEDVRTKSFVERRKILERWFGENPQTRLDLSGLIPIESWELLRRIREKGADEHGHEGVMIKRNDSAYVTGRPRGLWFKWKRDPCFADAILMYAQRGHGKRSSFYSDYTFGVWKGEEIVPIGKAYFGFTDEELKLLDKFVRSNTIARFGPVREVKKELVLEVAFDSAHESTRHKSGIALRFPRIHRIRWDKPVNEADTLEGMQAFLDR